MPRATTRQAAARLVAQSSVAGWAPWQLVQAIAEQCGVSLLQAARLARGWTLQETVTMFAEVGHRVTVQQLSSWEHGASRPSDPRLDGLCRLYQTRPDRLGYGADYTPFNADSDAAPGTAQQADTEPTLGPAPPARHAILRGLLGAVGITLSAPVMAALASARQDLADTLTSSLAAPIVGNGNRPTATVKLLMTTWFYNPINPNRFNPKAWKPALAEAGLIAPKDLAAEGSGWEPSGSSCSIGAGTRTRASNCALE
ncbi:helix-turn-helix domain-containing protein [Kitasatospora sp. NPDC087861]|uniref:helix-turn-helix domain-containing protein n=1 Tax=Kitasatospora sp. NPDC087861 TaxID=3364070 RepID=UPI003817CC29